MRKTGRCGACGRRASRSSGCVQTRQYADVAVHAAAGRLQAAGASPRRHRRIADHRRHGRAARRLDRRRRARSIVDALRAQQASARRQRHDRRAPQRACRASTPEELADVERLNFAVDQSIVVHKYLGDYLPTKRGKGLDWTLGARRGQARPEDRLRLCLVPPCRGPGRVDGGRIALRRARACRLLRRLLRAQRRRRAAARLCLARRPQDRRGRLVQRRPGRQPGAGHQVRRPPHAAGRGADGRPAARADEARRRDPPGDDTGRRSA